MNSMSNWIATAPFEPTATGVASLDIIQRNASGQWVNRPVLGTEFNAATTVAGANDTVVGTTNRYYTFFTLPTTAPFYIISGMEWLNGTVVNGNVMGVVEGVDANPPVSTLTNVFAFTRRAAQTGTSAIQRNSSISPMLIRGGTVLGAFIVSDSASGRFGTSTVGSANRLRALVLATDPNWGNSTAWGAGTEEPYIKVYAIPVLGV